jgi:hypothetical protein
MQPDGTYVQRIPEVEEQAKSSQQILIERAEKHYKQATRLKKRRTKGFAHRQSR